MSTESPKQTDVARARSLSPLIWLVAPLLLLVFLLSCGIYLLRVCTSAHSRPHGLGDVTFELSESGDELVFSAVGRGERDLFLLRLSDFKVTRLTDTPDYEVTPSFAPDAQSIVYAAGVPGDRADHIFVCRRDGTGKLQLTFAEANDSSPRVSPDGSLVVFDRDKTYNWGGLAANWSGGGVICVVGIDGRNERQITPDDVVAWTPWFLPDGKSIAYSTDLGIFTVPVDNSAPPAMLINVPGASLVGPARGDNQIVFRRGQYERDQVLWSINADGTGERQITPTPAAYYDPVLSSDGEVLYFLIGEWPTGPMGTTTRSLWRINRDGSGRQKLAGTILFEEPMKWRPEISPDGDGSGSGMTTGEEIRN